MGEEKKTETAKSEIWCGFGQSLERIKGCVLRIRYRICVDFSSVFYLLQTTQMAHSCFHIL